MKGKQFYFLLISLILVGVGSVFLYRQREEQRVLEFEGYEITAIESRIESLYNEEKTDISQNISEEELEEISIIFEELDEKKLSRRSRDRIKDMEADFLTAESMMDTERNVKEIFNEANIVTKDLKEEEIDTLEADVLTFDNMPLFIDRNIELLAYARQQVVTINRATEFVEGLFDEDRNVLESATREDEEEALNLIEPILNEEVKEELTLQVDQVNLVLTQREEQLALEEALRQQQEAQEMQESEETNNIEESNEPEEPQYTNPPAQPTPPAQSWTPPTQTWRPPDSSETDENTGDSENGQTDSTDDSIDSGDDTENGVGSPEEPGNSENDSSDEENSEEEQTRVPWGAR